MDKLIFNLLTKLSKLSLPLIFIRCNLWPDSLYRFGLKIANYKRAFVIDYRTNGCSSSSGDKLFFAEITDAEFAYSHPIDFWNDEEVIGVIQKIYIDYNVSKENSEIRYLTDIADTGRIVISVFER